MASVEYTAGQVVEVNDDGMWCKATLVEQKKNGKWKVNFPQGNYEGFFKANKIRTFDEEVIAKEVEEEEMKREAMRQKFKEEAEAKPIVTKTPEEQGLAFKEKGNTFFKKQKFELASNMYTRAIEVCPENAVFYNNRAMAELKLRNFYGVIADCTKCLELDSSQKKAYFRRGCARKELSRTLEEVEQAMDDFNKVGDEKLVARHRQELKMRKSIIVEAMREKNKTEECDVDELD